MMQISLFVETLQDALGDPERLPYRTMFITKRDAETAIRLGQFYLKLQQLVNEDIPVTNGENAPIVAWLQLAAKGEHTDATVQELANLIKEMQR